MNTMPSDTEYRIPTAESVICDTLNTSPTDEEQARLDAIALAAEHHSVDPDTERYDPGRSEAIGSKMLDIAASTSGRQPEFDWSSPDQLRAVGQYVVYYREIEKTIPRG